VATMLDVLKEMILDFQELHLDTGIPRRVAVSTVPGKATVCLGCAAAANPPFCFNSCGNEWTQGFPR